MEKLELLVIGGGLAGCEAAWQAARRGVKVKLYEMRPVKMTEAHITSNLAELVCSNSLGSDLVDRPSGLVKNELQMLNSLLMECARLHAIPAGNALAVDREKFSLGVTQRLSQNPNIEIIRQEVHEIPQTPAVIASGPLTSQPLSHTIAEFLGKEHLYFFDAIAPIVTAESVNLNVAFRASRYDRDRGDYLNCPMTQGEYEIFVDALLAAKCIELKSFEQAIKRGVKAGEATFFEGCLPIEILAQRGREALAFGPMKPIGLTDPKTGRRPYAVVQLRRENLAGSLYNLVGFQTNLCFSEQKRVLRLIPGLEQAEFVRYGQMHRNTFIASPALLYPTLQLRTHPHLFFAGQITGVEGYAGNIATGLVAGWNAARLICNLSPVTLPQTTMIGALCHYITHTNLVDFQPMKANFGILPSIPSLSTRSNKRQRAALYSERALTELQKFLTTLEDMS